MNAAYAAAKFLNYLSDCNPSENFNQVLVLAGTEVLGLNYADELDVRLHFLDLLDECIEQVSVIPVPDDRARKIIEGVRGLKKLFVAYSASDSVGRFAGSIQASIHSDLIASYGDLIETSSRVKAPNFSVQEFTVATEELIADLDSLEIEQYVKETLKIELRAVLRTVCVGRQYSSELARKRIKAIYADFREEFEYYDRDFEKLDRRLKRWMQKALGGGARVLGITADVTAVVGLLSPPSE